MRPSNYSFAKYSIYSFCLIFSVIGGLIQSFGQVESDKASKNIYVGGNFSTGIYSPIQSEVRVDPHHGFLVKPGLSFLFETGENSFFKIGVDYAGYRSPFINNKSYYEEYISIPISFSVLKASVNDENIDFAILFGPEISLRSRAGVGDWTETNYHMADGPVGGQIKLGLVSEFAFFITREKALHSFGVRASADIYQSPSRITNWEQQNYFTAAVFYSFYFKL